MLRVQFGREMPQDSVSNSDIMMVLKIDGCYFKTKKEKTIAVIQES